MRNLDAATPRNLSAPRRLWVYLEAALAGSAGTGAGGDGTTITSGGGVGPGTTTVLVGGGVTTVSFRSQAVKATAATRVAKIIVFIYYSLTHLSCFLMTVVVSDFSPAVTVTVFFSGVTSVVSAFI